MSLSMRYQGINVRLTSSRRDASCLLMLLGLTACGSDVMGDQDFAPEEVSFHVLAYSQRASAQSNAQIFGVSKGEYDMRLAPVATHQCFLTRVSGELDDEYSQVVLHHSTNDEHDDLEQIYGHHILDDVGDTWKLATMNGGSNSLSAEATCVPHSDFILDPGMVIWSSPRIALASLNGCVDYPYCRGEDVRATLWNADAISSLEQLVGDFNGGGESAEIIAGPQANLPSVLRLENQEGGVKEIAARSFFVGHPGQTSMWRSDPVSSSGNKKTKLIRTRDGVCYLTRFSGDFNGSEERVRIMPQVDDSGVERWVFETHQGGGKTYATAECVYYDQRAGCAAPATPCL